MTHEKETRFYCATCQQEKVYSSDHFSGYGQDKDGKKHCYECCGRLDEQEMLKTGRATLYLSYDQEPRRYSQTGWFYPKKRRVSNWPGTLSIPLNGGIKIGRHNIAGRRFDVWFWFKGEEWHGIQYGDNTQIIHCRRLKKQQKAA